MSENLKIKFLDHCFDLLKYLLTLFVSIITMYLALIAATAAFVRADTVDLASKEALRTIALLATVSMAGILFLFFVLVARVGREYQDRASVLSDESESELFARAYRKAIAYGRILAGVALIALFCGNSQAPSPITGCSGATVRAGR